MSAPLLRIAHGSRGRIRLRSVVAAPDPGFWERVARTFGDCPLVNAVSLRPATGSVVVEHSGPTSEVLRWADARGLAVEDAPAAVAPEKDPLQAVVEAASVANGRMRRALGGELDLRAIAFYGLIGAGVLQAARGQLWPTAETLVIHALGLLPRRARPAGA